MIVELLIFALGLFALYIGAKLVVMAATHMARSAGVSEFVVGATVVALGTSLPELSSSVLAMISGFPGLVAGNVLGSNAANMGLAIGLAALFYPIYVSRSIMDIDLPFLLASSIAGLVAFLDMRVSWIEGLVLLAMYGAFIAWELRQKRDLGPEAPEEFNLLYIPAFAAGLALLYYGAKYLVSSLIVISVDLGLSEAVVAFLLLAVGTSLPEISTSVISARDGKADIAMGNAIGSNSFNILIVLGASALLGDVSAGTSFLVAALSAVMLMSILLGFMALNSRVTRLEGVLLLLIYFLVIINIF